MAAARLVSPRLPVNLIEKAFAAVALLACLVLLLRLALGDRRRHRFDATLARWRVAVGRRFGKPAKVESIHARAEREAREAIERARRRAEAGAWDGNVYRPKSFKRKKRDLH